MEEKNENPFRVAGFELIAGFVLAVILLGTFAKLSRDILHHEIEHFDSVIGEFIRQFQSESVTSILIFVTDLGDKLAYVIIVLILLFILIKFLKRYLQSIFLVIAVLGSWGLNEFLKAAFERARPEIAHLVQEDGYSFPSGHAMVALAAYGMIGYIIWSIRREQGKVAWFVPAFVAILIIAIGTSRVYLGVHYPSDVIAGFTAGAVWLMVCIYSMRLIRYYQWNKGERLK